MSQVERPTTDNWFSAVVQTIAYPFQTTYFFISSHTREAWLHYVWLSGVREKNKALLTQIRILKAENTRNVEVKIAYERLLGMLAFKRSNRDIKVFAEVIGEIKNGFSQLIIINKGHKSGIKKNFGVVTPDGIVGKIQSVTAYQSVVQLITDSHSNFPVLIQRTRTKAFLQGFNGELEIMHVDRKIDLKRSDVVIASGLAGVFPKGFTVGQISPVRKNKFGLFQNVPVMSEVDFSKLEEVAIILKSVDNINQPLFTE